MLSTPAATNSANCCLPALQQLNCRRPGNLLCKYIPALNRIDSWGGSDSTEGLEGFEEDVRRVGKDPDFIAAQIEIHDRLYWDQMRAAARQQGLR